MILDVRQPHDPVNEIRWCGNSEINIKITGNSINIPKINLLNSAKDSAGLENLILALRSAQKELISRGF